MELKDRIEMGRRIKKARDLRDMTLEDIAIKIGVAKSTVQRYETGQITNPKIPVVQAIANTLNVNPSWLAIKSDIMEEDEEDNSLALSEREQIHILTYRDLSDQGKDRVDEYTERTRDLEKQDEDSKIVESFQNRFVARNGNKNLTPDQMKAIMDILDGGNKDV